MILLLALVVGLIGAIGGAWWGMLIGAGLGGLLGAVLELLDGFTLAHFAVLAFVGPLRRIRSSFPRWAEMVPAYGADHLHNAARANASLHCRARASD